MLLNFKYLRRSFTVSFTCHFPPNGLAIKNIWCNSVNQKLFNKLTFYSRYVAFWKEFETFCKTAGATRWIHSKESELWDVLSQKGDASQNRKSRKHREVWQARTSWWGKENSCYPRKCKTTMLLESDHLALQRWQNSWWFLKTRRTSQNRTSFGFQKPVLGYILKIQLKYNLRYRYESIQVASFLHEKTFDGKEKKESLWQRAPMLK